MLPKLIYATDSPAALTAYNSVFILRCKIDLDLGIWTSWIKLHVWQVENGVCAQFAYIVLIFNLILNNYSSSYFIFKLNCCVDFHILFERNWLWRSTCKYDSANSRLFSVPFANTFSTTILVTCEIGVDLITSLQWTSSVVSATPPCIGYLFLYFYEENYLELHSCVAMIFQGRNH